MYCPTLRPFCPVSAAGRTWGAESSVKHRPVRHRLVRRFVVALLATVIGTVGSFTVAAPGQASDTDCALNYNTVRWGDPAAPTYYVIATITNTSSVTSTT